MPALATPGAIPSGGQEGPSPSRLFLFPFATNANLRPLPAALPSTAAIARPPHRPPRTRRPSGTTANLLQLGAMLRWSHEEMPLLRLVMLAWMLPTDDHSFYGASSRRLKKAGVSCVSATPPPSKRMRLN